MPGFYENGNEPVGTLNTKNHMTAIF